MYSLSRSWSAWRTALHSATIRSRRSSRVQDESAMRAAPLMILSSLSSSDGRNLASLNVMGSRMILFWRDQKRKVNRRETVASDTLLHEIIWSSDKTALPGRETRILRRILKHFWESLVFPLNVIYRLRTASPVWRMCSWWRPSAGRHFHMRYWHWLPGLQGKHNVTSWGNRKIWKLRHDL